LACRAFAANLAADDARHGVRPVVGGCACFAGFLSTVDRTSVSPPPPIAQTASGDDEGVERTSDT
jgi:hypothetical protein